MSNSTVATPPLPDAIDPESSAAEQARLANGPLALTRSDTQPAALAAVEQAYTAPRRFDWPRLQQAAPGFLVFIQLWPLVWCITAVWNEFVGTWVLSWGLILPLAGLLILGNIILGQLGERLPPIGRSWVEIGPGKVRMRLFYGRKPRAVGKGFHLIGQVWPRRATIPWSDVARVAIYSADYAGVQRVPSRTLYWVKLWTSNGTGYVVLITDMEAQARELANLLAQRAGLNKWAYLDAGESRLLDLGLGSLDDDTLTIWRADRRRISNATTVSSVSAELWRAPRRELTPRAGVLRWRTVVKLTLLVMLLLAVFNYDYLLSYLLWSPPGPVTSDPAWLGDHHDAGNTNASNQTLIPPLHEVWHTKLPSGSMPIISLGGGKLMLFDRSATYPFNFAYAYDASSGRLLRQYSLNEPGYNLQPSDRVVAGTISDDGSYAYYVSSSSSFTSGSGQSALNAQLNALDLNTGSITWQQPLKDSASFVLEPQRNLIFISTYITTTISGAAHSNFVVEALNPQTGAQIWQSEDLGQFAPTQIAVGGDAVYAFTGDATKTLSAIDISNGRVLWKTGVNGDFTSGGSKLLADEQHVYLVNEYAIYIYDHEGKQRDNYNIMYGRSSPTVLANNRIITTEEGQVLAFDVNGDLTRNYEHSPRYNSEFFGTADGMAASNGLLFLTYSGSGNFFGNTRLLAFDLNSGRQVWRSPTFNGDYSGNQIIIGNGMLYMVYGGELHAYVGAR